MTAAKKSSSARDTDKLIRQLSLIAYLMARGNRRVDAETIRWNVEGYGDEKQNWDTFTRRFHRDREELARLGIQIRHERNASEEKELFWLPPENYFLPAVEFSREELKALNACVCLLDGQFAYSQLLRMAIQGLVPPGGGEINDRIGETFSVNLLSSEKDVDVASRQSSIEDAIFRRKSIVFDYYAISRDSTDTRTIDPFALMFTRGEWYLVGFSHERKDVRVFKLKRIRGRIRALSKNEHNYDIPEGFRINDYLAMEPWQLGEETGEAEVVFSPRRGWWAAKNLGHCGSIELRDDGSTTLRTKYSDGGPLCSLALEMFSDAHIIGPPALRAMFLASLEKIIKVHQTALKADYYLAEKHHPGSSFANSARSPQVAPERLPQLAKTLSYLLERLGNEQSIKVPVADLCRDLGYMDKQAVAQAVDLLRLVNVGAGGYLIEAYVKGEHVDVTGGLEEDLLKRPAHLSPREAKALLLAIDLVGSQFFGGGFAALSTAREKILKAAGGLDVCDTIAVGETEKEDFHICRVINRGLADRRLVQIEYLSSASQKVDTRTIEPYIVNRVNGAWYLHAWCLKRDAMRTFQFQMIKSATLLGNQFEPRQSEMLDLDRFTRDPRFPSGEKAPYQAEIRFSPSLAPYALETQANAVELKDGVLICSLPYFDDRWIIGQVLKYGGEAELISPAGLRSLVAETASEIAAGYEES